MSGVRIMSRLDVTLDKEDSYFHERLYTNRITCIKDFCR